MKKTILAILLILSLLAGFAACAKDPSDASGSDPAASVSGTEAAAARPEVGMTAQDRTELTGRTAIVGGSR